MVELFEPGVIFEGPNEITLSNVRYWSKHTKELKGTDASKALKFVEHDCIQYIGLDTEFNTKGSFVCLPLNMSDNHTLQDEDGNVLILKKKPYVLNYNNSDYKIYKNANNQFECNCQGWNSKEKRGDGRTDGCNCSHVLALFYCFKMKKFKGGKDEY